MNIVKRIARFKNLTTIGSLFDSLSIYKRTLPYYQPFLPKILICSILIIFSVGLNILRPWPVKWLIDDVLLKAMDPRFSLSLSARYITVMTLVGCCSLFIIYLIHSGLTLIINSLLYKIGLSALLKLRTDTFSFLQHLPLRFHESTKSGDMIYRIAYDTQSIMTFFIRGLSTLLSSLLLLAGTLIVMLKLNFYLATIALGISPLLWLIINVNTSKIRHKSTQVQEQESQLLSETSERISAIRLIHAYSQEDKAIASFKKAAWNSLNANYDYLLTTNRCSLLVTLVTALGTALILFIGTKEVLKGSLSIGQLWIFLSYLASLYQPMEQLSYTSWTLESTASSLKRIFELFDIPNELPDPPKPIELKQIQGKIEFRNVSFRYSPEKVVLKNLSFVINPGEHVAIVGPTGSGKTTILSLICRFYDPDEGEILIDGIDIRQMKKKSLRQNISLVLQDTMLFNTTVEENISFGKEQANSNQVIEAARQASVESFIAKLPKGYHTVVGEKGALLSGGQRQKIGLARAFLRNTSILLLDEPTSSLDLKTEQQIMSSLQLLMENKTTLFVTHRLHAIQNWQRIIVLVDGQICEEGNSQELLNKKGVFYRMWTAGNFSSPITAENYVSTTQPSLDSD
ncbi:ABC transporter ATP-binding protein [Methylacidiphilum caldifontis]|uniref:Multidrug ABC transporter ATP-binding protein n=1 Tax=Methylacidiphilum caldifontis TaxID=2795386 RepID=A0A4Y8PFS2_9BACT|nr:ABC transporter ATP-binding protein [Methylacidiphilum caldifontis]QSR88733.1 ABC transporter ATP-binding protein [Methylacidiphilum caldifontis]TFE70819.1 multidrug ABC transporter ATP-binding protein [Methylacidiphilum caldifontis]